MSAGLVPRPVFCPLTSVCLQSYKFPAGKSSGLRRELVSERDRALSVRNPKSFLSPPRCGAASAQFPLVSVLNEV